MPRRLHYFPSAPLFVSISQHSYIPLLLNWVSIATTKFSKENLTNNSWDLLRFKLVELSKERGFKAELARKMGVAPSLIQNYVDGNRTPGLDQLDKFAAALGVQPWELIKPIDSTNSEAKAVEDASLKRVIDAWTTLDEYERGRVADITESLAGVNPANKTIQPPSKKNKSSV